METQNKFKTIEDMMIDKGLTVAGLAKEVGVAPRTVYAWKNGQAKPTLTSIYKLARFFKVDPRVFLD